MRAINRLQSAALALLLGLSIGPAAGAVDAREWQFRVYLDDREIGYHNFRLKDLEAGKELETEARFRVKFLFFNAYEYRHLNTERWEGDCLKQIEARTFDNGDEYRVEGTLAEDRFLVELDGGQASLPGCVMTFAYWNPDFLNQDRLLNAQTGEYLDVRVEPVAGERITVRGEPVEAIRYRVEAGELRLDLWYSQNREWLALESTTEGGRKLRYVLI